MAEATGTRPYIGDKISLVTTSNIRYTGTLYTLNRKDYTIAVKDVRSYGTETRKVNRPVEPSKEIYDLIVFRGDELKDLTVLEAPDSGDEELEQDRNPHDSMGAKERNGGSHWDNVWSTPPSGNPWKNMIPHAIHPSQGLSTMNDNGSLPQNNYSSYCYPGISTTSVPSFLSSPYDQLNTFLDDDPFLRREREEEEERLRLLEEEKNSNKISGASSTTATFGGFSSRDDNVASTATPAPPSASSYAPPPSQSHTSDLRGAQDWCVSTNNLGGSSAYGSDTYSTTRNTTSVISNQQQQPYLPPENGFASMHKNTFIRHSSPLTQNGAGAVVTSQSSDHTSRHEGDQLNSGPMHNNDLHLKAHGAQNNTPISPPSFWSSDFRDHQTAMAGSGQADDSWRGGEVSNTENKSWGEYKPFGDVGDWQNQGKWEPRNSDKKWRDTTWDGSAAPSAEAKEEPKLETKNDRNYDKRWDELKTPTKDEKRQNSREVKQKEPEASPTIRKREDAAGRIQTEISPAVSKTKSGIELQQRKNGSSSPEPATTETNGKEQLKNGNGAKESKRGDARRFNSLNDVFNHHRGSEALLLEQLCSCGTQGWSARQLRSLSERSPIVYHVYLDFVSFCCHRETNMDDETSWTKFSDATKKNFEGSYKEKQGKELSQTSAVSSSAVSSKPASAAYSSAHEVNHPVISSTNKMYSESSQPAVYEEYPSLSTASRVADSTRLQQTVSSQPPQHSSQSGHGLSRRGPTLGDFAPLKAKEPKKKTIKEKAPTPVREKAKGQVNNVVAGTGTCEKKQPGAGRAPMKKLSLTAPTPGAPSFGSRTPNPYGPRTNMGGRLGGGGGAHTDKVSAPEKLRREDGSWNCPRCTLLNDNFLLECAACACPLEHASTLSEFPPLGS